MLKLYFENIICDQVWQINTFASLLPSDDEKFSSVLQVTADEIFKYETNIPLWLQTFKLALPMLHISAHSNAFKCVSELTGAMVNHYAPDYDESYKIETKHEITAQDIDRLKRVNSIITKENKAIHEGRKDIVNPWTIAYQLYQAACASHDLFQSILSLSASLETLILEKAKVMGTGVATYGSRLFSEDSTLRHRAFETIDAMLDLRTAVLEGDMHGVKGKFFDEGFLKRYFLFKDVCATALVEGHDQANGGILNGTIC